MKNPSASAKRDAAPPAGALDWLGLPALELGGEPLRPLYANRRAQALFGGAASGEGSDWARGLWGEDAERVLAAAGEVLRQGEPRVLEHGSGTPEGSGPRRLSTHLQIWRVPDGR